MYCAGLSSRGYGLIFLTRHSSVEDCHIFGIEFFLERVLGDVDWAGRFERQLVPLVHENGRIQINMDERPPPEDGGTFEQYHIRTLVHEMLHAFLAYYACECRACRWVLGASEGGM
jgi:imidazoleglycerol phosphate dehydratase HisB